MYTWIWRHLPGSVAQRLVQVLMLVAVISLLLLFVIFPWLTPHLPSNPITGSGTVTR
jgi:competence protein ComGC